MAITNLISGEVRNKVGGMVGAKWKGKSYVRAYVIPKNPRTEEQTKVRNSFTLLTHLGSRINETVLKPYQARPVRNKSPFNVFTALNKPFMTAKDTDLTHIKIFNGALPLGTAAVSAVSQADQEVEIVITPFRYGLALPTDTLIAVVYNQTKDSYNSAFAERGPSGDSTITVPIPTETGDELFIWVTAAQKSTVNAGTLPFTATVT
jgi:hypothetical protein